MIITAFFTDNGEPKTGLTPTIRIRDIDTEVLIIMDELMSEVGDGWYKYNFLTYNKNTNYGIRCDGGETLSDADRYTYAGNENFVDDINETISENLLIQRILGQVHENVYQDECEYDEKDNLISARRRLYSIASSVGTDNDIIAIYRVTATYENGRMVSYQEVLE